MKKLLAIIACMLLLVGLASSAAAAGQVTDTLTVMIGYFGMDTEDYVEVASYHWSELYASLPLYQSAYSFFRISDDGSYYTVIDSAYGFYISDLLDYAGIYSGDIQSLQFYTQDQSVGYFTSFTYSDLFNTQRYFFNDLPAHIHAVYDEEGNFAEYDFSEAWNDCYAVQPMLALEDSWATYEIGTEHTAPNYSSMGTGNRFRLLFGQSSPMESRTNQSAKYTHTVYVTLDGAPVISDGLPEFDGTIGSHTIAFDVSVGNNALLSSLSELLQIESTDTSVLEVTDISVALSSDYSDTATVSVSYTVHSAGSASLAVGYAGTFIAQTSEIEMTEAAAPTMPPAQDNTEPSDAPAQGNTEPSEPSAQGNTEPSEPSAQGNTEPIQPQKPASDSQEPATQLPEKVSQDNRIYLLSNDLSQRLQHMTDNSAEKPAAQVPPQQEVVALAVQEKDQRPALVLTCAGALVLGLLGAICAIKYYSTGRKRPL